MTPNVGACSPNDSSRLLWMYAIMCDVAEYRRFASEYRRLAALLTRTADKEALELFAIGWDKIANNREAMLQEQSEAA